MSAQEDRDVRADAPGTLHADKGYDYTRCRHYLTQRGIGVRVAPRGIEDSTRLGRVGAMRPG